MKFTLICGKIIGHLDAQCDCAVHKLQDRTHLRLFGDHILTVVGVEMAKDAAIVSFTAACSFILPLYDRRDDVLLEDPMLLILLWAKRH